MDREQGVRRLTCVLCLLILKAGNDSILFLVGQRERFHPFLLTAHGVKEFAIGVCLRLPQKEKERLVHGTGAKCDVRHKPYDAIMQHI